MQGSNEFDFLKGLIGGWARIGVTKGQVALEDSKLLAFVPFPCGA